MFALLYNAYRNTRSVKYVLLIGYKNMAFDKHLKKDY